MASFNFPSGSMIPGTQEDKNKWKKSDKLEKLKRTWYWQGLISLGFVWCNWSHFEFNWIIKKKVLFLFSERKSDFSREPEQIASGKFNQIFTRREELDFSSFQFLLQISFVLFAVCWCQFVRGKSRRLLFHSFFYKKKFSLKFFPSWVIRHKKFTRI